MTETGPSPLSILSIPRRAKRRWPRRLLLLVVLAAAGVWAWRTAGGSVRFAAPAAADAPLPTLRAARADLVESTVAVASVQAQVGAEVRVGSRLSGVVAELSVGVGDRVEVGAPLARLEDDELRVRVDVLSAQLRGTEAELEFAQGDLDRAVRLGDLLPTSQLDAAKRALRVRRAEVERMRASLAEARLNLSWSVLRAPVAGTIASVSTYVGETVAASFASPTFLTIIDLRRLEVRAFVDETDIGRVRVGQAAEVTIDAFPGRTLPGVVRAVYPKAQLVQNVVNYVVIVDLVSPPTLGAPEAPNPLPMELRPEMTARVGFVLDRRTGVIVVPRSAVGRRDGSDFVWVKSGEAWSERTVRLGLTTPQRVEIESGLEEGEVILADRQAWSATATTKEESSR
jgi:macrolide-specific efflux system membrane fusion protein